MMRVRASLASAALISTIMAAPAFAQPAQVQAPQAQEQARAQAEQRQRMQDATPDTFGTGPYLAIKEIDPGLQDHVVWLCVDPKWTFESKRFDELAAPD